MNPYKMLKDLLPDPPLQIGTVSTVSGQVVTVQLLGGGTVVARGTATAGHKVFVRNDVIEGEAPALSQISIDV
jgi:hypothetical protein